mgnify:CR=1 FL=1
MKWASISKLSHAVLFYEFCTYLTSLQYSYGNTVQIFSMLNKVQKANHILPIGLVIPTDQSTKALAIECCAVEKTKPNQFYAMPTSIMEKIYSRASHQKYCKLNRCLLCHLWFDRLGRNWLPSNVQTELNARKVYRQINL